MKDALNFHPDPLDPDTWTDAEERFLIHRSRIVHARWALDDTKTGRSSVHDTRLAAQATARSIRLDEAIAVADFHVYFNVADELDGGAFSLDDLEPRMVEAARRSATHRDLPWPPLLSAAEDYALDHAKELR